MHAFASSWCGEMAIGAGRVVPPLRTLDAHARGWADDTTPARRGGLCEVTAHQRRAGGPVIGTLMGDGVWGCDLFVLLVGTVYSTETEVSGLMVGGYSVCRRSPVDVLLVVGVCCCWLFNRPRLIAWKKQAKNHYVRP